MLDDKPEFNQSPSTYKLIMADMSQVYCGRSLSPNNYDDDDDAVVDDKRLTSLLETAISYRPVRKNTANKTNGRAKANHDDENDERAEAALCRSVGSVISNSTEEEGSSNNSRRGSDGDTTLPGDKSTSVGSSNGGGNNNATLRRKCQPLHKCATVNQSVSSIMRRPSRYSMTSSSHSFTTSDVQLVNENSIHSTSHIHNAPSNNRRFSRRASGERGLPAQSMHSYFLQRESLGNSQRSLSSLDDPWVASGVDFSSSVEVYVFRK